MKTQSNQQNPLMAAFATFQQMAEIPLFTLFTRADWRVLFETTAAKFVLLPAIAVAMVAKGIIATYELVRAKEKTPGKILYALVNAIPGLLVAISVTGFLAANATFALAGPAMFIAAVGTGALYNLASLVYYTAKGFASKDHLARIEYRDKAIKGLIGALTGATIVAAVFGLFLFPFAPAAMSILAAVTVSVVSTSFVLNGGIMLYDHFKSKADENVGYAKRETEVGLSMDRQPLLARADSEHDKTGTPAGEKAYGDPVGLRHRATVEKPKESVELSARVNSTATNV